MQSMATGLKYNKVKSVLQYNIVHKFCSIKYSNVYVVQCSLCSKVQSSEECLSEQCSPEYSVSHSFHSRQLVDQCC